MVQSADVHTLHIYVATQYLEHRDASQRLVARYPISTASKGLGEKKGSYCTPRGLHIIRAKIGAGLPENAVLVGRRYTGEIYSPILQRMHPERDWILSRILWLSGCERGKNRLGDCDTMRRYVYIHGTPDSVRLGEQPNSKGCIRMYSQDIIALFDRVPIYSKVFIDEGA